MTHSLVTSSYVARVRIASQKQVARLENLRKLPEVAVLNGLRRPIEDHEARSVALGQGVLAAKSPPPEALECLARFGIRTWPQAILKWVLSDTRVTSVLPATTSLQHAQHNAVAGDPPWFGPDERDYVASLAERL